MQRNLLLSSRTIALVAAAAFSPMTIPAQSLVSASASGRAAFDPSYWPGYLGLSLAATTASGQTASRLTGHRSRRTVRSLGPSAGPTSGCRTSRTSTFRTARPSGSVNRGPVVLGRGGDTGLAPQGAGVPSVTSGQALIDVRVPVAEAVVSFEGNDTRQNGPRRMFQNAAGRGEKRPITTRSAPLEATGRKGRRRGAECWCAGE